jgi:hypothetical protein
VIVSIPGAVRTTSLCALASRRAIIILVAALCLPAFSTAQTAPANASSSAPSDQSQPAPSNGATLSPDAHPDATSVGIPTASQIESASSSASSNEPPDPSAGSPPPKPSTTPSPSPASPAQPSTLAPKYNVALIGQRNVGNGLDFYSIEREVALGRQLAHEVESNAKVISDPVVTEYVNRIGQNLVRNSDARVPFVIKVLDTEEVNAFALPGGFLREQRADPRRR